MWYELSYGGSSKGACQELFGVVIPWQLVKMRYLLDAVGKSVQPALAMKWRLVVIAETAYVEATASRRADCQIFSLSKYFFSYDIVSS